jgi:hypothetical protein
VPDALNRLADLPFLHAVATNPAIALYEKLGFLHRRATMFAAAWVPEGRLPELAG